MSWWERAYLLRDRARPLDHRRRLHAQHVALDHAAARARSRPITRRRRAPTTRARNRGKHVLTQRPDGRPQCIACNLCATVCPAKVIEIEAAFDPDDPAHPKYPARFEIDYSRCIFCGLCVEACPEDAIRMVKEVPDCPTFDRDTHVARHGRAAELEPAARRCQALPARRRQDRQARHDRDTLLLVRFSLRCARSSARC